jgi:hypothetical protein
VGGLRPRIGARPRSRRGPAVSSETCARQRVHEEREELATGTARGQSPRVTAEVLVRGDVLRGVSALRGGRGFHGRKRSEPQGRQQVETPAARARSNPARRCKTARSEHESEGMAAFGRRARRSSTGDPESHRWSYGPGRIGALGVDACGPVVSSRDEWQELREGIRLSGGEPFGWSTEGRRTPGVPQGACGCEPQERKVEACSHALRPGHEGRALERSPRSGGSLSDRAPRGGRTGIEAKRKTSRTRRVAAGQPGGHTTRSRRERAKANEPATRRVEDGVLLGNRQNRPRPRGTGEPHESGPQGRTSWFERL